MEAEMEGRIYNKHIDKETEFYYYISKTDEMFKLSYQDYMQCVKEKESIVEEESEDYHVVPWVTWEASNNEHDKIYKTVLSKKKEACQIINIALHLEGKDGIEESEIEPYNSSFITNQLENREADIVYRLKEKNIFFLIEHQSSIDHAMPFRIEEYKMEIKKRAIDRKKARNKNYEIPEVIPIVIYTGKQKWNVRQYLNKIEDRRFKNVDLAKYNIIDINEYEKEELKRSKNFIDKIFLLEKTEDSEEIANIMDEIIEEIETEEERMLLIIVMKEFLRRKLSKEKIGKLIKKIKGEGNDMLRVEKMIIAENRRIRKEGIKEGMCKVVKEMKKQGLEIKLIKEITGFSEEEISKIN